VKTLLVTVLGFLIFIIRLCFLTLSVLFFYASEACDWCDERCLDTLDVLDPTKEDRE